MPPEEQDNRILLIIVAIMAAIGLFCLFAALGTGAWAHEATDVNGNSLHIVYPSGCCQSAATSPNGDCAPISDEYVTERADGYHINIPVGGHPKLKTKGYIGIVHDAGVKQPISNDYHICLSTDGATRFCFFPKPGAV